MPHLTTVLHFYHVQVSMEMGGSLTYQINIFRNSLTLTDSIKLDSKNWKDPEKVLLPSYYYSGYLCDALLPTDPVMEAARCLGGWSGESHSDCTRFLLSSFSCLISAQSAGGGPEMQASSGSLSKCRALGPTQTRLLRRPQT